MMRKIEQFPLQNLLVFTCILCVRLNVSYRKIKIRKSGITLRECKKYCVNWEKNTIWCKNHSRVSYQQKKIHVPYTPLLVHHSHRTERNFFFCFVHTKCLERIAYVRYRNQLCGYRYPWRILIDNSAVARYYSFAVPTKNVFVCMRFGSRPCAAYIHRCRTARFVE